MSLATTCVLLGSSPAGSCGSRQSTIMPMNSDWASTGPPGVDTSALAGKHVWTAARKRGARAKHGTTCKPFQASLKRSPQSSRGSRACEDAGSGNSAVLVKRMSCVHQSAVTNVACTLPLLDWSPDHK
eukprot:357757-Chlamydomonas_euryale.AAC.6